MRGTSRAPVVALLGLALALGACSQGGLTDAERSRATTLPTPTQELGPSPERVLIHAVQGLLAKPVSVDDDHVVDEIETESRLTWRDRARVVDASVLPLGGAEPAAEIYRGPGTLLTRAAGVDASCWRPAGPKLARYDRPQAQELSVLLSTRVTFRQGSLLQGTVSAVTVLRVIGTDAQLSRQRLLPPPGIRVPASVAVGSGRVIITVGWGALVTAAGNSSRHSRTGTWTFRYQPLSGPGPTVPAPDQVVRVPQTSPGFASALRACNARLQ